ncbi:flocculation protein FLO11-like isoform X1 [Varroa destructor]|uniref:chitinase n=2 Tax=Varroa destructor TaxID=109461 RepID=A0A7M7K7W8_VARDE|nr:flocculation protein FLO11-like isoform X1 [Varroa destructor]XP_022662472.1 flocculation protein FLO11-like isoform X1 [Varroa destructor]XP_022662474.1 flocculation protein FLO11-like isoform X1 [Varroa destructor]
MRLLGFIALTVALAGTTQAQRIIKRPQTSLQPKSQSSTSSSASSKSSITTNNVLTDTKMVCYYSNWAIYRPALAKFTPQNINPFLCSHLIYAFAGFNKKWEMKPFDPYNDIEQGNYKKFVGLKQYNPALKTMVAVGGWNEGSKRFTEMVENAENRQAFVRSAVKFCRIHSFDGLDLDWEYPTFREGGRPEDKEGYALLIKELREAFDAEKTNGKDRLLLSVAVPAGKDYIDQGFDVKTISDYADFLNILTYDYHTAFEAVINHHAPLRARDGLKEWDDENTLNIDWTVTYYLKKGAPANKLILGIPTYGRSFTLSNADETDLDSPASGPGQQGEATREKGYLAYYEICQAVNENGWELARPHEDIMGPVAFKGTQWVSFDDEIMIANKVKYIKSKGLGGAMIWTLDNDDFRGSCGGGESPLISALRESLLDAEESSTRPRITDASSSKKKDSLKSGRIKTTTTTPAPKGTQRSRANQSGAAKSSSTQSAKSTKPKETGLLFTTPEPPTTPDPGTPFECEDEGFFPNDKDCRKYYWCLDSGPADLGIVAHTFTCPSNLHFNSKTESCDFKDRVKCKADKGKSKAKKITTTSAPAPEEEETSTARPSSKKSKRPSSRTTLRTATSTSTTTSTTTTTRRPSTRRKTGGRKRPVTTTTALPEVEDDDFEYVDQELDPTEESVTTRRVKSGKQTEKTTNNDSIAELVRLLKDHLRAPESKTDESTLSNQGNQVRGPPAQLAPQTQAYTDPRIQPAEPGTNLRRPVQVQYREPVQLFQEYANPSRQTNSRLDSGLNVYVAPARDARPLPEDAISPFKFSYSEPLNRPAPPDNYRELRTQNGEPEFRQPVARPDVDQNDQTSAKARKPKLDNSLARAPYNPDRFDLGDIPAFGFSEGSSRGLEEAPAPKPVTAEASLPPSKSSEPDFIFDGDIPDFSFSDGPGEAKPQSKSNSGDLSRLPNSRPFRYDSPGTTSTQFRRVTTELPFVYNTPQRQSRPAPAAVGHSDFGKNDDSSQLPGQNTQSALQFDYQQPQRDSRQPQTTFTYSDPPLREQRPQTNQFTYNETPQRENQQQRQRGAAFTYNDPPQRETRSQQTNAFTYSDPPQRSTDAPAAFSYSNPQRNAVPPPVQAAYQDPSSRQQSTTDQFDNYQSPQRNSQPVQSFAFNYEASPQRTRQQKQQQQALAFNYDAPPQRDQTSAPNSLQQYDAAQRSKTKLTQGFALDTLVPDPLSTHDEGRNVARQGRLNQQHLTTNLPVSQTPTTTSQPATTRPPIPPLPSPASIPAATFDDDEYYYDDYEDEPTLATPQARPTVPPQPTTRATVPPPARRTVPVSQTSPRRAVVITTPRPSRRPVIAVEPVQDPYAPPLIVIDKDTIDCNKRGVFIHPNDCTKFVVCAPGKNGLKGFVHNCPAETIYVTALGRCLRGDRKTCTRK